MEGYTAQAQEVPTYAVAPRKKEEEVKSHNVVVLVFNYLIVIFLLLVISYVLFCPAYDYSYYCPTTHQPTYDDGSENVDYTAVDTQLITEVNTNSLNVRALITELDAMETAFNVETVDPVLLTKYGNRLSEIQKLLSEYYPRIYSIESSIQARNCGEDCSNFALDSAVDTLIYNLNECKHQYEKLSGVYLQLISKSNAISHFTEPVKSNLVDDYEDMQLKNAGINKEDHLMHNNYINNNKEAYQNLAAGKQSDVDHVSYINPPIGLRATSSLFVTNNASRMSMGSEPSEVVTSRSEPTYLRF